MNEDVGKQKVCVYTRQFKITGQLAIYPGVRLTDYMNESKGFISITDADVAHHDGKPVVKSKFINIRKDGIEIILPEDMVVE
jgi:hypothetical protein